MAHKLALIGFGVVGQGLVEILRDQGDYLKNCLGFEAKVVAVSDINKGALYDPTGLDLDTLLDVVHKTGKIIDYPQTPSLVSGWNSLETITQSDADTIVEVSYTDVQTGQPAIDHCKAAFSKGKNVVLSNKGPVALAYQELTELSKKNGVRWGFEGTVMSGTPALRMPIVSLAGNKISQIRGILNGTTNYILSRMEDSLTYEEALREAQSLGYAEANPTNDVEGYDVLYKVVILAHVLMNVSLTKEQVTCQGITTLTLEDIQQAKKEGKRWKLIAEIKKEGDKVHAAIRPEKIDLSDPLAGVMGPINAVTYTCNLAGDITLVGAGAGKIETGYSLLIDLINIVRRQL